MIFYQKLLVNPMFNTCPFWVSRLVYRYFCSKFEVFLNLNENSLCYKFAGQNPSFMKGAVNKRRRNFFGRFWHPPPPCRNFDPDLPNFYLMISCNIEIWDPPYPLKHFDIFYVHDYYIRYNLPSSHLQLEIYSFAPSFNPRRAT